VDTIYRTLSQHWIRYITQCNSKGLDISHTVTVLDKIYSTLSKYWIRYIAHCQGNG